MQKLTTQKNRSQQDEIEAEKAFYAATEDLKHAGSRFEIIQLEIEQLFGEESDVTKEIVQSGKALAEIKNKVKAMQARVVQTTVKVAGVTSKMDDYNQRVVEYNLKLTSLNAGLQSSNGTLRRLRAFQEDAIKRYKEIGIEITKKNQKKIEAIDQIQKNELSLIEMYADLRQLELGLARNESDYQALTARLQENDRILADIQNTREKTLAKLSLLEVEQSQRHIQLENINNRLKERYHKSIAQLRSVPGIASKANETVIDNITYAKMEAELIDLRKKIAAIQDVNLSAIKQYEQLKTRFDFLCRQREDLLAAIEDLQRVIRKINRITQKRFMDTFNAINEQINDIFPRLFEGGSARLVLTQPDKPLETGVEFMIHPPGKKLTRMSLLSGGEKALSAIALIFSIFLIKPTSFCVLDEIDAPLDEVNVFRFNDLLKVIGEKSQILMITHNKKSMEFADTLFGITMEKKGISKLVSVNFKQA